LNERGDDEQSNGEADRDSRAAPRRARPWARRSRAERDSHSDPNRWNGEGGKAFVVKPLDDRMIGEELFQSRFLSGLLESLPEK
jgi:hypothetical protein